LEPYNRKGRAMRILVLLLIAGFAVPVFAAKTVTVEELERAVAKARGAPDAKMAKLLSDLELTDRLSMMRFASLEAELPGPGARQALLVLFDESAFLNLPAAEVPVAAPPERNAQILMLALAQNYAAETISKMPNFFATRATAHFEDTPAKPPHSAADRFQGAEPVHFAGSSSVAVYYRDGHEMEEAGTPIRKKPPDDDLFSSGDTLASADSGYHGQERVDAGTTKPIIYAAPAYAFTTSGEFGPTLATVLMDATHGEVLWDHVTWDHWEQGARGLMAVFHYAVSDGASHYKVWFPDPVREIRRFPAYHGEIAVNPADGSILRVTMVAELKPSDPITKADLMVEYGPVEIGGMTYICPVKSVALSRAVVIHKQYSGLNPTVAVYTDVGPPQTMVNDVTFEQYHLFRSETRILSGGDAGPNENPPASGPGATPSATSATPPQR
jgi:hypothetical protein